MDHVKQTTDAKRAARALTRAALAVALAVGLASTAAAQETRQRYLAINDPLAGYVESTASLFPAGGAPIVIMAEAQRLEALNIYSAIEMNVDNATAKAVTTSYVANQRKAVDAAIQHGVALIAKLDADVAWYENPKGSFPDFIKGKYDKTDPRERKAYENYQDIKLALDSSYEYRVDVPDPRPDNPDAVKVVNKVLVKARKTLKEKADDVADGWVHVLERVDKANYALASMREDSKYIAERMEALNEVLYGLQDIADSLSRDGPHAQLLATVTNSSDSLVFFVQVLRKDDKGQFAVRPDTRYPIPLYPNLRDDQGKVVVNKDLQIAPFGQRGISQLRAPVATGDRLVVRVATMGQMRDKVRFQQIKGNGVHLDLSSLSRGFYYLGYGVESAEGVTLSRWYPTEETYTWTLSDSWQKEQASNALELKGDADGKDLDGKPLREFKEPLKLTQDRLEWTVPDLDKVKALGGTTAEIAGTAQFTHRLKPPGLGKDRVEPKTEEGHGKLKVYLESW